MAAHIAKLQRANIFFKVKMNQKVVEVEQEKCFEQQQRRVLASCAKSIIIANCCVNCVICKKKELKAKQRKGLCLV